MAPFMAVVVKTVVVDPILVGIGEFTAHVRTDFSGNWDVHWGYGVLTHGHMAPFLQGYGL